MTPLGVARHRGPGLPRLIGSEVEARTLPQPPTSTHLKGPAMPEHKPITILDELPPDGRNHNGAHVAALLAAVNANPGKWVLAYESVKSNGGYYRTWRDRGCKVAMRKNPDGTVNYYVSKPLATGGE